MLVALNNNPPSASGYAVSSRNLWGKLRPRRAYERSPNH